MAIIRPCDPVPNGCQWRPIAGYDYEISEYGQVRRTKSYKSHLVGDFKTPRKIKGYWNIILYRDSKGRHFNIHRLVTIAFHGEPPFEGALALHWDDEQDNCHCSNLRWGTVADNHEDQRRNGGINIGDRATYRRYPEKRLFGEKNKNSKLTAQQALEIRNSLEPTRVLMARYGVADITIHKIRAGKAWKHLGADDLASVPYGTGERANAR